MRSYLQGPNGKMDYYLCAALGEIGHRDEDCIRGAARRLRVSRRTVVKWMDEGPGSVPIDALVKMAVLGRTPQLLRKPRHLTAARGSR